MIGLIHITNALPDTYAKPSLTIKTKESKNNYRG